MGYVLLWGLGMLALGVCLVVTWWGLFGDSARGRRRCPRCWYDLSHTDGLTCSECGHRARRERSLHRTRRRPLPALLAALIAALGASWTIEQAQRRGWLSFVPTRAILLSLPLVGDEHEDLNAELAQRIGQQRLSDAHWRALVRRCVAGDRRARPASPRWERKYGDLLERCRGLLPDEFDLDRILIGLPARIDLESAPTWPQDAPVCVSVGLREWWPSGTECRLHLDPAWNGDEPTTLLRTAVGRQTRPYPLVLRAPPRDGPLQLDVRLERKLPADGATWEVIQQQTIRVPIEFVGTIDDTVESIRDEALDDAVRSTFSLGVVKWTSGHSPVRVRFDPRRTFGLGTDTAIGASVELLYEDTLARRLDMWWRIDRDRRGWGMGWHVAYEDVSLLASANDADGRWRMRVRSDPALALRAGNVSKFWAGEFTVPLTVDDRKTKAPPKDWRVEPAG